MEDFSSIFWVLFVVGALVLSTANQRKRQQAERKRRQEAHDEAWSSENRPASRAGKLIRKLAKQFDELRPYAEAWPSMSEYADTPEKVHTESEDRKIASPVPQTEAVAGASFEMSPLPFETEPFPGEIRSLEEIPSPEPACAGRSRQKPLPSQTPSGSKTVQSARPVPESPERRNDVSTTEEVMTELQEDFDIRKAVVYAEILKPKFDE